jgi:hypothetical protein
MVLSLQGRHASYFDSSGIGDKGEKVTSLVEGSCTHELRTIDDLHSNLSTFMIP